MSGLLFIPAGGPYAVPLATRKAPATNTGPGISRSTTKSSCSASSIRSQSTRFNPSKLRYESLTDQGSITSKKTKKKAQVASKNDQNGRKDSLSAFTLDLNEHRFNGKKLFTCVNLRYFQFIYWQHFVSDSDEHRLFLEKPQNLDPGSPRLTGLNPRLPAGSGNTSLKHRPLQTTGELLARESRIRDVLSMQSFWNNVCHDLLAEDNGHIYCNALPPLPQLQSFFVSFTDLMLNSLKELVHPLSGEPVVEFDNGQLPQLATTKKLFIELFLCDFLTFEADSSCVLPRDFVETLVATITNNLKINYHGLFKSDQAINLWHAFFTALLIETVLGHSIPAASAPQCLPASSTHAPSVFDSPRARTTRNELLVSAATSTSAITSALESRGSSKTISQSLRKKTGPRLLKSEDKQINADKKTGKKKKFLFF